MALGGRCRGQTPEVVRAPLRGRGWRDPPRPRPASGIRCLALGAARRAAVAGGAIQARDLRAAGGGFRAVCPGLSRTLSLPPPSGRNTTWTAARRLRGELRQRRLGGQRLALATGTPAKPQRQVCRGPCRSGSGRGGPRCSRGRARRGTSGRRRREQPAGRQPRRRRRTSRAPAGPPPVTSTKPATSIAFAVACWLRRPATAWFTLRQLGCRGAAPPRPPSRDAGAPRVAACAARTAPRPRPAGR